MSAWSRLLKNFAEVSNVHLPDLRQGTPIEIWFQMLCSRGLCQTGKPHIWNRSACMSSSVCHQIIYLAIELSSSSWVIACRVPRNDKAKLHRLEAGDGAGLLAFIVGLRHRLDPPD